MQSQRIFASMFARRLALLYAGVVFGMGTVSAQLVRLTVFEGADHLAEAERPLVRERWTETTRGRILDRHGRVLARNTPSFDALVDYSMISGVWALQEAGREARRASGEQWGTLSRQERDALIEARLPAHRERMDGFWETLALIAGVERGELEESRTRIVRQVQRMSTRIWERRRQEREEEWARSKETEREFTLAEVARPIREQRQPHVMLRNIDDETAFALRRLAEEFDALVIEDAGARAYPYEAMTVEIDRSMFPSALRSDEPVEITVNGVATHLIGWMRGQVLAEDIQRRPRIDTVTKQIDRGHYRAGDSVGATGVERGGEDEMRGLRGLVRVHLDTGEEERTEREPGRDVSMTIDVDLQARVQALLDPAVGLTVVQPWHENQTGIGVGEALASGAVVLDVESGDILAAAGWPTFTRQMLRDGDPSIFEDPILPAWVDRATERAYAPASIAKPLTFCEAVYAGKHDVHIGIECNGHFLPNRKDVLRCWIYRERFDFMTHTQQLGGALLAPDALARSCNIYFYTLGRALGPEGMHAMYRRLGVLQGLDIGVGEPRKGQIGRTGALGIETSDAIMMAMGQGPVTWTPLHAASAYAALARGGLYIEPRLLQSIAQTGDRVRSLGWRQDAIDSALQGLEGSLHEDFGTGNHIYIDGVMEEIFTHDHLRSAGKTGTGQASPTMHDPDGDGPEEARVVRRGDHAWTTVLVGPKGDAFQYAISVVVEHGGSGGRVAGPIVNQIIEQLIETGYLPSPDAGVSR